MRLIPHARLALVLLAVALCRPARAEAPAAAPSCAAAGAAAERAWNLPAGLLGAIGRVEAGRFDPSSGTVRTWPWTINAQGQGHYFITRQDAIAAVRELRMAGVDSIDVGCFQINLVFHPGAFASLDEAFDPTANADAAARFLAELYQRSGSWETAVAWYHSATPGLGEPYRDRVLADWRGGGMRILPVAFAAPRPGWARPVPGRRNLAPPEGLTVRIAAHAFGITVWAPATPAPAPRARSAAVPVRAPATRRGLPRIITPQG
jgi:hypothetical protein